MPSPSVTQACIHFLFPRIGHPTATYQRVVDGVRRESYCKVKHQGRERLCIYKYSFLDAVTLLLANQLVLAYLINLVHSYVPLVIPPTKSSTTPCCKGLLPPGFKPQISRLQDRHANHNTTAAYTTQHLSN